MAKEKENPLLSLKDQITEDTLADIEERIESIKRELHGLEQLRKVAYAYLGKELPKGAPGKKPKKIVDAPATATGLVSLDDKRQQIVHFLATNGPQNGNEIIAKCRVEPRRFNEIMECDWFVKSSQGWNITTAARQKVL